MYVIALLFQLVWIQSLTPEKARTKPGILLQAAIPILSKHFPTFRSIHQIRDEFRTSDPERLAKLRRNPRLNKTSAPMAKAMLDRGKKLLDPEWVSLSYKKPVAVFHGTSDFINIHDSSAQYIDLLNSNGIEGEEKQGTFFSYKDYYHDMFLEAPRRSNRVLKDFKAWLLSNLTKTSMESSISSPTLSSSASTLQSTLTTQPSCESFDRTRIMLIGKRSPVPQEDLNEENEDEDELTRSISFSPSLDESFTGFTHHLRQNSQFNQNTFYMPGDQSRPIGLAAPQVSCYLPSTGRYEEDNGKKPIAD